jgi:hypothetical protein
MALAVSVMPVSFQLLAQAGPKDVPTLYYPMSFSCHTFKPDYCGLE